MSNTCNPKYINNKLEENKMNALHITVDTFKGCNFFDIIITEGNLNRIKQGIKLTEYNSTIEKYMKLLNLNETDLMTFNFYDENEYLLYSEPRQLKQIQ
jgi:hypothetical protein